MDKPSLRLTLRTLLAYLDDTLDPSQGPEIARKITESNFALRLVERIRKVVRKRRIGAPSPDFDIAAIDANDVAEYLDNVLDEGQVADLERRLMDSDIQLAETASVHQLLSMIGAKPVHISPEQRDRIVAMASSATSATVTVDVPATAVIGAASDSVAAGAVAPSPRDSSIAAPKIDGAGNAAKPSLPSNARESQSAQAATTGEASHRSARRHAFADDAAPVPMALPPYFADAGSSRWHITGLVAGALIIMLVIIWTTVQLTSRTDGKKLATERVAQADIPADSVVESSPNEKPAQSAPGDQAVAAPESALQSPSTAEADKSAQKGLPRDAVQQPIAAVPPKADAAKAAIVKDDSATKALAENRPAQSEPSLQIDASVPLATYTTKASLLLGRDRTGELRRLKSGDLVFGRDELIAIGGRRSTVEFQRGVAVELVEPCRIRLRRDPTNDVTLELLAGRLLIRSSEAAMSLRIGFTKRWATLAASGRNPMLALELRRSASSPGAPVADDEAPQLFVHVIRGEVHVEESGASRDLVGGQELTIGTVLSDASAAASPPGWIVPSSLTDSQQHAIDRILRDVPVGVGAEETLSRLIGDNAADVRRIALGGLAMIDNAEGMFDALNNADHGDIREQAISALQNWLAEDASRARTLGGVLLDRLDAREAEAALSMLLFRPPASQLAPTGQLPVGLSLERKVECLASQSIGVRELAIAHLRPLAGTEFGYEAHAAPGRHAASIAQWRQWATGIEAKSRLQDSNR